MAHRDDATQTSSTEGTAGARPEAREPRRYEPPRILGRRSVVDATLQTFSGSCTPGQPGCDIGGH